MDTPIAWLGSTSLSRFMVDHSWAWLTCTTTHFVGLSFVIGVAGVFDARLLGLLRRIPLASLRGLLPWGFLGVGLNVVSGVLLVVGAPQQYLHNPAFYAKLACLVAAGVNVWIFEAIYAERLFALGPHDDTPRSFKVAGAVSIVTWALVVYFGRVMPFMSGS